MTGVARWLARNPGKTPRILVSRKDDATLGLALRKLTRYAVVTPADGEADVSAGMVFFQEVKDVEI